MEQVVAQQNLRAAIVAVMPLLSFASAGSCEDATATLINLLKEALEGSARATKLKSMCPRDLVLCLKKPEHPGAGFGVQPKRRKVATTLSALDIWPKRGESVQMVAALSWWCEAVAMWEAVRTLLALDDERKEVVWESPVDDVLLERWYRLYSRIPGLKGSPKKSLFNAVVRSVITGKQGVHVIWSGRSDEDSCELADCGPECDGRHMGLRVRCDGVSGFSNQIGVSYNPKELKSWAAAPATPKHKDPTAHIRLVQSFLKNSDNVFKISRTQHVFMIGLWGLVEHCCDSPSLNFAERRRDVVEISHLKQRDCSLKLIFGSTTCALSNGFCVWNYGEKFVQQIVCKCFSCAPG